jgi:hypothetical protein
VAKIDRFVWTTHADERLLQRGLTRERVEGAIQALHPIREANDGEASWRVDAGTFIVVYEHPHADDGGAARIISAWVKTRPERRIPRGYSG